MVRDIPQPPPGLLELATDLARHAEFTRAEVASCDAWMASGFSHSLVAKARLVEAGVRGWVESIPPTPDSTVNPHGPVRLVGPTMTVALHGLSDAELAELDRQLQWDHHNDHRPVVRQWLENACADVRREQAVRLADRRRKPGEDADAPRLPLHLPGGAGDRWFVFCDDCARGSGLSTHRGAVRDLLAAHLIDHRASPVNGVDPDEFAPPPEIADGPPHYL